MLLHKLIMNLYMFGTKMQYRINGQINCTKVVTENDRNAKKGTMKFKKQRLDPSKLSCSISKNLVFTFNVGMRDHLRFTSGPGDKIGTKRNTIPTSAMPIIKTTCPICIIVS